jgi:hypothetical protein
MQTRDMIQKRYYYQCLLLLDTWSEVKVKVARPLPPMFTFSPSPGLGSGTRGYSRPGYFRFPLVLWLP